jgi:hypothetical protein
VTDDAPAIVNLAQARFECTFGRGCEGVCCRHGRPPVYPDEIERIGQHLPRFLPLLRAKARQLIERRGFVSGLRKVGEATLRSSAGWCGFFNRGCVLHRVGHAEGDRCRFKPVVCSLFPIQKDRRDRWKVRQKGYDGEKWDLPCLAPEATTPSARESLAAELALALQLSAHDRRPDAEAIAERQLLPKSGPMGEVELIRPDAPVERSKDEMSPDGNTGAGSAG